MTRSMVRGALGNLIGKRRRPRPRDASSTQPVIDPAIEASRGLLALAVTLLHLNWLLPSAYLAVDIFFVISGLVIGERYEARLRTGGTLGRFLVKRFIRLSPLHAVSVGVALFAATLADAAGEGPFDFAGLAWRAALLIPAPWDAGLSPGAHESFPLNPPAWSLLCEVLATLLFALVCRGPRWLIFVPLLGGLATLALAAADQPNLSVGGDIPTFCYGLARVGYSFCAGVVLARAGQGLRRGGVAVFPLLCLAALAFFAAWPSTPGYAWGEFAFIVCVGPALAWLIRSSAIPVALHRIGIRFGALSYALYLLHVPVQHGLVSAALNAGYDPSLIRHGAGAVATTLITILVAWVATDLIDTPMRSAMTRLLMRGRRRVAGRPTPSFAEPP